MDTCSARSLTEETIVISGSLTEETIAEECPALAADAAETDGTG
jgi:hypothetical protein